MLNKRSKVNELRLDHKKGYNHINIISINYEDPKFLEILEALHNTHPYINLNTFDAV